MITKDTQNLLMGQDYLNPEFLQIIDEIYEAILYTLFLDQELFLKRSGGLSRLAF